MKCLIYCTKDNHQLVKPKDYDKYLLFTKGAVNYSREQTLNGKVVAEFECNNVEEIPPLYKWKNNYEQELESKGCITQKELFTYLKMHDVNKCGYALHINNLKVFDEPKELSEFKNYKKFVSYDYTYTRKYIDWELRPLTKAPQNMCYCEYKGEKYCLISIRPEWVCKILNGEKTIEVRTKVLKEMLEK